MSRRKGEVTSAINERDFPHIVELPLPSGGFRSRSDDMLAFHRERGIERVAAAGTTTSSNCVRYCFADPRTPTPSITSSAVKGLHRPQVAAGRAGD
jgi:hypothetical protein